MESSWYWICRMYLMIYSTILGKRRWQRLSTTSDLIHLMLSHLCAKKYTGYSPIGLNLSKCWRNRTRCWRLSWIKFLAQAKYTYSSGDHWLLVKKPSRSHFEIYFPRVTDGYASKWDIFHRCQDVRKFFKIWIKIIRWGCGIPVAFLRKTADNIPALTVDRTMTDIALGTWYQRRMMKFMKGMVKLAKKGSSGQMTMLSGRRWDRKMASLLVDEIIVGEPASSRYVVQEADSQSCRPPLNQSKIQAITLRKYWDKRVCSSKLIILLE